MRQTALAGLRPLPGEAKGHRLLVGQEHETDVGIVLVLRHNMARNPEDALDAMRISHSYLDICFFCKAGIGKCLFAFDEYSTDRIDRLIVLKPTEFVEVIDDGAVETA